MLELTEEQRGILTTIRDWVKKEVTPVASPMEQAGEYPFHLVEQMKEMGLFGILIPKEYGGLGMDYVTYALVIEELTKGWMSIAGILTGHTVMCHVFVNYCTPQQKERYFPLIARGEKRGGVCITEPNAGSDVQAIQTRAELQDRHYVINGTKTLISNSRHGNIFCLVAKTDLKAEPPYRGISLFIAEKGEGFNVVRDIPKLGFLGSDTCELSFEDYRVPQDSLVGGEEGRGFAQLMSGLEAGRINSAARGVGIAQAALEAALSYSQQRYTFGKPIAQHQAIQLKLADMATQVQAARLLTLEAARKKDQGQRSDMEVGMAKLFASEVSLQVSMEAMRIHGGYGYTKDLPLERHYRDAPILIIGEGTNEIQRLIIARNLLKRFSAGEFDILAGT
ncbi:MAG: acyl-CoA dehydrogenase family protein [Dehalococcoidia bacterium]